MFQLFCDSLQLNEEKLGDPCSVYAFALHLWDSHIVRSNHAMLSSTLQATGIAT